MELEADGADGTPWNSKAKVPGRRSLLFAGDGTDPRRGDGRGEAWGEREAGAKAVEDVGLRGRKRGVWRRLGGTDRCLGSCVGVESSPLTALWRALTEGAGRVREEEGGEEEPAAGSAGRLPRTGWVVAGERGDQPSQLNGPGRMRETTLARMP